MNTDALLDEAPASADAVPACEKCQTPIRVKGMAACPRCGYYPSLGIFIEVAPWEAELNDPNAVPKPQPSHLEVWSRLIPGWGWRLLATSLAIVVMSIAVRLLTETGGTVRTTWSVTQLLGGLSLAVLCHIAAFLWMLSTESDMGITDVVVKPLKIWLQILSELPHRFWLLNTANAGLTAALCAALIIGGIPYERLWDWGFKAPPKQNLMGALMEQAQKAKGNNDGLEKAIGDFAGSAGAEDGGGKSAADAKPLIMADCVIIGYTPLQEGKLVQLWLASEFKGKLVFVGRVTPRLESTVREEILSKLAESHSVRPLVSAPGEPQWVRPTLTCRVSFTKRDPNGRFVEITWNELLGEVKLPW
ncbi:MAG: hypothetical protein WD851_12715 [Pirellulales bacterium]